MSMTFDREIINLVKKDNIRSLHEMMHKKNCTKKWGTYFFWVGRVINLSISLVSIFSLSTELNTVNVLLSILSVSS
jgi:hypothetical protein